MATHWIYVCPHCGKNLSMPWGDMFRPWRMKLERDCLHCGNTVACQADVRAVTWFRFGLLTAWPALAYLSRVTLYAETKSGLEGWAGAFMVGFIPAIILAKITDRLGFAVEIRRSGDVSDVLRAVVLYVGWLAALFLCLIWCLKKFA